VDHGINDKSVPLVLIYDEARTLCEYEAFDGTRIHERHVVNFQLPETPSEAVESQLRSFSNFRALRRALRYLSAGGISEVPKIFGVFTDSTTSRITNFQPTSWNDPSLRVGSLPQPGQCQFPPIFVFSSVDVYSRVLNPVMCISSPHDVADPHRLLKFGRAGWYSTYVQGNALVAHKANLPNPNLMVIMATLKLLSIPDIQQIGRVFREADFIKMVAVLAPRLALTIGPYTSEASELIASHLAVLTRTDNERHFLRTVYPSEPVLAEASARLTNKDGWANPLSALIHYVHGGIVEAGFRGELLTKIVCLMAMDKALSQNDPVPEDRWTFSQPISVSKFLDQLIVPLRPEHSTFSECLKGIPDSGDILPGTLNVNNEKLQRFLRGNVFFNHFIRVDVKLSYAMLVQAWNRGAAIMCMTNTKGIDHVIPVMLDKKGDAMFGPLHGSWGKEHTQQARQHISYILINSKNYASGKDQTEAAWATKFSASNLKEYRDSDQATESDLSDETDDEDGDQTDQEDFNADSQYIWHADDPLDDELNVTTGTGGEEMNDVEMSELHSDNVFLSLIQDFDKKCRKEAWVSVGAILRTHRYPRRCHPPREPIPLDRQVVVILKGASENTYEFLKNHQQAKDASESSRTSTYLKMLRSAKVDYVDKTQT
jgi:hypothetical protein